VLVAGGGVAALEAVLTLEEIAGSRLELTLLTPRPQFEYTPLSVAEPFGLGVAHRFDLGELFADRAVRLVPDSLEAVDADRGEAHTASGRSLGYEALLVAVGGRRREALPGAVTFSGPNASSELRSLLRSAVAGRIQRLLFAVPGGVTWALPAYELALMSRAHFAEQGIEVAEEIVTPEPRPLDAFGGRSSRAVAEILELRGIAFRSALPARAEPGRLVLEEGESLPADAVVALPTLAPPAIAGLPRDRQGFLPVDEHGRVEGLPGVYAAGDVTGFPLKQGGIAAQQADAAAQAIAASLGEQISPEPFRPVLRGLLLTGRTPRFLRAELVSDRVTRSMAEEEAIWWPPAKIAGRRLGPFLALHGAPGGAPPGTVALKLDGSAADR
jgi:sulfide:quinone oxidoreductase